MFILALTSVGVPYGDLLFCFNVFTYLFIFWLNRVFVAVCGLCLIAASGLLAVVASLMVKHGL